MRTMKALEDKMERERDLMSEAALNFRESKEESGIRLAGFHKWCTTENDVIRLRILDWLKHIGNQWLERMSLSQAEREGDATPLPRSAFRVAKNPGLRAKFAKITMEDFEKVFDKYAQHGQMSEAEFDRALSNMGVTVPYLRKRFFAVFDDSESGFIEVKEFMAGFQLLMQDDRDKKLDLAFKMFDIEGNGYVSESEMRRFLSTFFRVGEEGAQAVIHDFESLFGPDKKIAEYVHSACRRLAAHYLDVVMKNIFESQKLAAPGPGGQRRLFITDFKLWSAQNGDRVKDWLDSLGDSPHLHLHFATCRSPLLPFSQPQNWRLIR